MSRLRFAKKIKQKRPGVEPSLESEIVISLFYPFLRRLFFVRGYIIHVLVKHSDVCGINEDFLLAHEGIRVIGLSLDVEI